MKTPWNSRPCKGFLLLACLVSLAGFACRLPFGASPSLPFPTQTVTFAPPSATLQPAGLPTSTPTLTRVPSETPTRTGTPTPLPTGTPTLTPSETPTPSITPTYAILRVKVLQQSNCRYGPGAAYLYKYGVYEGTVLEIIGRDELGAWVVVQAIGGTNPCWVKASLLEIRGEVLSVAPMTLPLPQSPYYNPPPSVSATRSGDAVTISWIGITLRAGDDSLQFPYLVEAWVCSQGRLVFTPVGSWVDQATILDEAGCAEPSHARLYAVEKHGYTAWVEIPWPPHP